MAKSPTLGSLTMNAFVYIVKRYKRRRRRMIRVLLESAGQDIRYACRSFVRTPGIAISAIIAIALGIGACTAVFSVVDRLFFRALPYAEEDRVVSVGITAPIDPNEF